MKINNIKINSFGKLSQKEIELSENINIIHGENESGKSTLLKFIIDMFYGISKNKRGKEFSDYDRYKPWDTDEFSGKITYTLDNGKKYEVFRDFNKKNPQIYNDRLEEISKEFNINKLTGNEFFTQQTKVDETTFLSTLVSMQQEVKLEKSEQNILIQKVANFASTGSDNVSYKKAIEKLNKKQIEEIGTDRSQGRPINIIKQEKEKIINEKNELINFKDKQYEIEEIKNKIQTEIINDENKLEFIKKINLLNEKEKLENEKIKLNKNIIIQNEEKIKKLIIEKNKIEQKIKNNNLELNSKNKFKINNKNNFENFNNLKNIIKNKKINIEIDDLNLNNEDKIKIKQIDEEAKNTIKKININKKNILISILVLVAIFLIDFMFTKINYLLGTAIISIPMGFLLYITTYLKCKSKLKVQIENLKVILNKIDEEENKNFENQKKEIDIIKKQIEMLEKNIEEQESNINELNNKNDYEINIEKEKIKNNYIKKINNENKLENNINNIQNNLLNNNKLFDEKIYLEINNYLNKKNLISEINLLENKINKNKLEIHTLELDKNNIIPKLERLSLIEEKLQELNEQEENLNKENQIIELVKEILEISYNKMKDNVTPKFTNNLSKNIEKISNGKYKKVRVNDEEGIIVEKENGEYISCEKLSIGTIEQLYLSLRFAMIDEISEEKMPIILDEAFAYYDTQRLTNILKHLNEEYKDNQIIIFTCTDREKEILEKENIKHNYIKLK